jgi:hypothetical protein
VRACVTPRVLHPLQAVLGPCPVWTSVGKLASTMCLVSKLLHTYLKALYQLQGMLHWMRCRSEDHGSRQTLKRHLPGRNEENHEVIIHFLSLTENRTLIFIIIRSFNFSSYIWYLCNNWRQILQKKKNRRSQRKFFWMEMHTAHAVTLKLTRVEAGSNTSTVTLRVVRGDEMGLKKDRAIA